MIVAILLALVIAVSAQDCTLAVPSSPLTSGLSSLWYLQAPCNQSIFGEQQFVEATILDQIISGKFYVYHPLVVNAGSIGEIAPTVPTLPANY